MKTSSVLLAALVLLLCGCAASSNGQDSKTDDDTADVDDDAIDDDTTPDDDTTADDDADDDATWGPYDFGVYNDPLGDLPNPPWTVETSGTTTFQVVKSPDLFHEHVLEVNGGWGANDYGSARVALPADVSGDIIFTLVFAVDDAKWLGIGIENQPNESVLVLEIYQKKLMAWGPQYQFECSPIAPGEREQVEVYVSTVGTYDVVLNDEQTNCAGIKSPKWTGDGYSDLVVFDDNSNESGGVADFNSFLFQPWNH